jgi:hypothetical protein
VCFVQKPLMKCLNLQQVRNAASMEWVTRLADHLLAFKEINCSPLSIVSRLTEGEDLQQTLSSHDAKWHDSCRLQYNKTKLERVAKRQAPSSESADAAIPKKYTRHSSVENAGDTERCFFCGEPAKDTESFHHIWSRRPC